ncbi:uncharacterized protein LOC142331340 [Lycorma delicatula]|uniref:uncharacterized protein LOC142331340 n=1 Tax=Lycorma delicatula TaxID=130591 RepID=UPI003F5171B7
MHSTSDLCRLCASSISSNSIDLFSEENTYLKKIRTYFKLELYDGDKIPLKICGNCAFELENIDNFQERCIQTQKTFEATLNKCHYKILCEAEPLSTTDENGKGVNNVEPPSQQQLMVVNSQPTLKLQNQSTIVNNNQPLGLMVQNQDLNISRQQLGMTFQNQSTVSNNQHQIILMNNQNQPVNNQWVLLNNQIGLPCQNQSTNLNVHVQNISVNDAQMNNSQNQFISLNNQPELLKNNYVSIIKEAQNSPNDRNDDYNSEDENVNDWQSLAEIPDCKESLIDGKKSINIKDELGNIGIAESINDEDLSKMTVELVKKVKKEKLDVCEELLNISNERSDPTIHTLIQSQEELIVGPQMDDVLLKAFNENDNFVKNNNSNNVDIYNNINKITELIKGNEKLLGILNSRKELKHEDSIKGSEKLLEILNSRKELKDLSKSPEIQIISDVKKPKNTVIPYLMSNQKNPTITTYGFKEILSDGSRSSQRFILPKLNPTTKTMEVHSSGNKFVPSIIRKPSTSNFSTGVSNNTVAISDAVSGETLLKSLLVNNTHLLVPASFGNLNSKKYITVAPESNSVLKSSVLGKEQRTINHYNRKVKSVPYNFKKKGTDDDDPDYSPHPPTRYQCPICDRRFLNLSQFTPHMKTHNT